MRSLLLFSALFLSAVLGTAVTLGTVKISTSSECPQVSLALEFGGEINFWRIF